MNRPFRVVAFDFDGTLVDSNAIKRGAFYSILGHIADHNAITEVLDEDPLRDRRAIIGQLLRRIDAPPHLQDELVAAYGRLVHTEVVAAAFMPGAEDVVGRLCTSFPVYVVSATPDMQLLDVLRERRLDRCFKGVFGNANSKPKLLTHIAQAEEIRIDELLMVGDQQTDRLAAQQVGCAFVATGALAFAEGSAVSLTHIVDDLLAGRLPLQCDEFRATNA